MPVTENVKRTIPKSDEAAVRERWGAIGEQYPLLIERAMEWGFDPPEGAPSDDGVTVWRLPPIQKFGAIYAPENMDSPNVVGVLVAWGMRAMESMQTHGYTLGQHVVWERFSGWEADDQTPEHKRCSRFLKLRARQVLESQDVQKKLISGELKYITDETTGKVRLQINALPEMKKAKRRAKLEAVADDPSSSPQERETAARILKRKK